MIAKLTGIVYSKISLRAQWHFFALENSKRLIFLCPLTSPRFVVYLLIQMHYPLRGAFIIFCVLRIAKGMGIFMKILTKVSFIILTGLLLALIFPSFVYADNLTLSSNYTFSNDTIIDGDLNINGGTIDLNGKNIIINGNVTLSGGILNVNSGQLDVKGNLSTNGYSSSLKMTNSTDAITVVGDFLMDGAGGVFSAGVLDVKGNFTQSCNSSGTYGNSNFNATGTHKVVFSGTKAQTIKFTNPDTSGFNDVEFINQDVIIASSLHGWRLVRDTNIPCSITLLTGTMDLNGHKLSVNGDLIQSDYSFRYANNMNINGGQLEISGNYSVFGDATTLNMTNEADKVVVGGDFLMEGYLGSLLSAGMLELKGNFTQSCTSSGTYGYGNFNATGTHKVEFSGTKAQTIKFTNPDTSGFNDVEFINQDVIIASSLHGWRLVRDTNIPCSITLLTGTMDLNGHKLSVNGDLVQSDYSWPYGGQINIDGGQLEISGNYSVLGYCTKLKMTNSADKITVGGDFLMDGAGGEFSAGVLEIRGNFTQSCTSSGTYGYSNFCPTGTHKVVLSGSGEQTVSFATPDYSGLNILIIYNNYPGRVVFLTKVRINQAISYTAISGQGSIPLLSSLTEDNSGTLGVPIAEPIDSATGAHVLDRNIFTLNGARDLTFDIHYNSLLLNPGSMGRNWTHDYGAYLELVDNSSIKVHWSPNRANTFTNNGQNQYTCPDQSMKNVILNKSQDGSYTLTLKDQSQYQFNTTGVITDMKNCHGQALNLSYDGTNRLDKIIEPISGQSLTISYNADSLIATITDTLSRKVYFTYDSSQNLIGVTDPSGKITTYTYDSTGRVLTGTDPSGTQVFSDTYDSMGRIIKQGDAVNHLTTLSYDESSQPGYLMTTIIDRNSQTTVYKYDTAYNLLSVKDALGNTTQYTYDANGNRTSEMDANSNTTAYTYDSQGNLLTIKDPQGHTTSITYDSNNNLISMTNAAGKIITYTYDSLNNVNSVTDPLNHTTAYTYDNNGLLQSKTTPENAKTIYLYANGLLQSVTDATGNNVSYQYDSMGRQIGQTNPDGGQTQMTYNDNNELTNAVDPLGNTTLYTYDANGNKLSVTDPNGNKTSYAYDLEDNLTSQTDPLGNKTLCQYDNENHLIQVIDALGNTTTYQYDAAGRKISSTDPLGNIIKTRYDALGNLKGVIDARSNQILTIAYDTLNNPITKTDALGNKTTNQYDLLNRVTATIDPMGHTTQLQYDDVNNMVASTDPKNGISRQEFDADGNRISLTDPNNNQLTFTYDALDHVTKLTNTSGNSIGYQYNSDSLVSQMTNGRGQAATYQYDKGGRIISSSDPTGTISYSYDKNGNLLTASDSVGTISKSYDALNRIVSNSDVYGNVIKYQYDAVGNLVSLTYPDGKVVTYNYDKDNCMTCVTDWADRVTTYQYDANGRILTMTRTDGSVETRTYNIQGQLLELKDVAKDGTGINDYNYMYDANGNVLMEKNSSVTEQSIITTPSTKTMTYGSDNRLATYNGQEIKYDADGNMIQGPLGGTMGAFTYDSRNRLISAGEFTYTYDATNNRVAVTQNGVTTRYVVNNNAQLSQVLMETDEQGKPEIYYDYGIGLLGEQEAQGNLYSYHYDYRGSTVSLTDNDGKVSDRYIYDSYGKATVILETIPNLFIYNGRDGVITDENGLYHMRARYYNPEIKRFISQDSLLGSIDDGQRLNYYAYTNDNPVIYIDPSGHIALLDDLILAGTGAVVGAASTLGGDLVNSAISGEWKFSSGADYIGNIVGGAVGVWSSEYATPLGGAALGNATAGEITKRLKGEKVTAESLIGDATEGAVTSIIPGLKVPGITSGRNSFAAVFKSGLTKIENQSAKRMSIKTLSKGITANTVGNIPQSIFGDLFNFLCDPVISK